MNLEVNKRELQGVGGGGRTEVRMSIGEKRCVFNQRLKDTTLND